MVPLFEHVVEIKSFTLLGERSCFTALTPKISRFFDRIGDKIVFWDFCKFAISLSLASMLREPTDGSTGKVDSDFD